MKKFSYLFENNELVIPGVTTKPTKFKLYESNMMPMLRCFHIRKISGCSWVSTSSYKKVTKDAISDGGTHSPIANVEVSTSSPPMLLADVSDIAVRTIPGAIK